ncbi:hypothetical protein CDL15_Pgr002357 [Punica granatum]|uniref:Uncharacterized protein n=1 Tax=Punica granatum TaxID=22663 RepID=A0A218XUR6_PUNGR|nr:hypothetical protein CDL15_Pgr002357 [Punica granatum]
MEEKRLAQFYTSKDQPLYSNGWEKPNLPCPLSKITLPGDFTNAGYSFYIKLDSEVGGVLYGSAYLTRPKYKSTLSFLKLKMDGNLRVSTLCTTRYKVEGVDLFLSKYTTGRGAKESYYRAKCSKDRKCTGLFLQPGDL